MKQKNPKQNTTPPLLVSRQEAARQLGLTKRDVRTMVDEGLLREVVANGKPLITARSIVHTLGYDPYGVTDGRTAAAGCTKLSFAEYAVRLLNRGVGQAHSRTTENYRCALNIAAAELGALRMTEIGAEDLRRVSRRLESRYAQTTLDTVHTVTRLVLRTAFERGDIPADPTLRWAAPVSTKPRKGGGERVYTPEQVAAILRTSRAYDQELYTMLAVLDSTGMRPGELLALEWASFDADARTIRVYQAVTRKFAPIRDLGKAGKSRSVVSVPKTAYSVRTLLLTETAAEALTAWRAALRACGDRRKARSRYVFPGRGGGFRSLSGAEKLLQNYRAACDMPGVTFYKFRHTMCTRLTLERCPVSVIQRILGDNSPDVITRVYTHIGAEDALRAMSAHFAAREC